MTEVRVVILPPASAVERIDRALCDCNVITEILDALIAATISADHSVCPTAYAYLAKQLHELHEGIEVDVMVLSRGRV